MTEGGGNLLAAAKDSYGSEYTSHLFEQYKLCVRMVDNLSHRRSIANSFFLSVNSGMLAILGLFLNAEVFALDHIWRALITVPGIVFSASWLLIVASYRNLAGSKWEVISSLEEYLPARVFGHEWDIAKSKNWRYMELTKVEKIVPVTFVGLYAVFLAWSLIMT